MTLEPSNDFLRPRFEYKEGKLKLVDVVLSQDLMSQRRARREIARQEARRREEMAEGD